MLVALDQRTGERRLADRGRRLAGRATRSPPRRSTTTGCVITGVSGGEFSIRGRVQAYDAKTGKLVWRFHTIPGPGEVGHDTLAGGQRRVEARRRADVADAGRRPRARAHLLLDRQRLARPRRQPTAPGDNLFAASIVALDAKTGKYRWHFQQVHHDIWDYDAPEPGRALRRRVRRQERKALAQPSKTGWLYLLDRETGKPLYRSRRAGAAGPDAEDRADAADPAVSAVHPARRPTDGARRSRSSTKQNAKRPRSAPPMVARADLTRRSARRTCA